MQADIKPVIFLLGLIIFYAGWQETLKKHSFIDFTGEMILVAGVMIALAGFVMTILSFKQVSKIYKLLFALSLFSIMFFIITVTITQQRQSNRADYCAKYLDNVNGGYNNCLDGFLD